MPAPSLPALPGSRDLWAVWTHTVGPHTVGLVPPPCSAIPVRAALACAAPSSGQGGAASHPPWRGTHRGARYLCPLLLFPAGLACCVHCGFKRGERKKITRFSVSADFSDVFVRCCRCGGTQGPPALCRRGGQRAEPPHAGALRTAQVGSKVQGN